MSTRKELPEFIVKIHYLGEDFKVKKGLEPMDRPHTRYLHIYSGENFDELIGKAWKKGARAHIFQCAHKLVRGVSATGTKGVWK